MKQITNSESRYAGICYGTFFFLLVKYSYWLVYRLIEKFFLFSGLNLLIIPILLVLIILAFALWYARMKDFPKLRVIYFVICFCFNLIEPFLFVKSSVVARMISDDRYSQYQTYISLCNVLFVLLFLTISFYKYTKTREQECDSESLTEMHDSAHHDSTTL